MLSFMIRPQPSAWRAKRGHPSWILKVRHRDDYLHRHCGPARCSRAAVSAQTCKTDSDQTGEQAQRGLNSAEIGSLLLREWGLPAGIIEDVRAIDHILLTPMQAMAPQSSVRRSLRYLCARIGERLALGTLSDLSALDLANEQDLVFFHLKS